MPDSTPEIFLDLERMKYRHTGLHHFCLQLCNHLIKNATGEQFCTFLPKELGTLFGDRVKYRHVNLMDRLFISGASRFKVWHMTNQHSKYMPASDRTKMILTIHDLNYLYEHKAGQRRRKKYAEKLQRKINRADSIACISEYTRRDVIENLGVDGKKISVIYNGCNFYDVDASHIPTYLPGRPFLFTVGTILPKKNFHVLPPLLKMTDAELIISGTKVSGYADKILEEAKRFNVADRIKFTGPISDMDKTWYYANCQAFVFPSLAEGFGLPVLEAMYFKKPVFLSNLTALPEIGGKHAYYFENFSVEHMHRVFEDGLNDYFSKKDHQDIQEWALGFSWDHAALKYLELYRQIYKD